MPQPGQVFRYIDFVFSDGSKGDKIFVILNNAVLDSPCLVLKTTSQPNRYIGVSEGCNPQRNVFFVPQGSQECFRIDTYIKLPEIIEVSMEELLQGSLSKQIYIMDALSPECFVKLRSCLKQFRNRISERHQELIF